MSKDDKFYDALQSYELNGDDIIMYSYQNYTYALNYNKNSLGENIDVMAIYVKKSELDKDDDFKLIKRFDTRYYTCDYEEIKNSHVFYFKDDKLYLLN